MKREKEKRRIMKEYQKNRMKYYNKSIWHNNYKNEMNKKHKKRENYLKIKLRENHIEEW